MTGTEPESHQSGQREFGYTVAPVAVPQPGSTVAVVPFPTNIPAGPVPLRLGWCVLQNSSPYALQVTQGSPLKVIPGFTTDLVEVLTLDGQSPIVLTPLATAQAVAPGTDSTCYATWYVRKPEGAFPSAHGGGAISTTVSNLFVDGITSQLPIGTFNTELTVDVARYATIRYAFFETMGLNPITFDFLWTGNTIGPGVQIIVPAGGGASGSLVNQGDQLELWATNNGAAAGDVQALLTVTGSLSPGAPTNAPNAGSIGTQVITIGAGATTIVPFPVSYAGPVYLFVDSTNAVAWTGALMNDYNGNGSYNNPLATFGPAKTQTNLILPYSPCRLVLTNNDAGNRIFRYSTVADFLRD